MAFDTLTSSLIFDTASTLLIILVLLTLPLSLILTTTHSLPTLQNARILLLTAHPDDECMFFAPTLCTLLRRLNNNQVKLLCLSTGDAAGLGATRKNELVKSADALGLDGRADVVVLDDLNFRDGMRTQWDEKLVADVLRRLFAPAAVPGKQAANWKARKSATAETAAAVDPRTATSATQGSTGGGAAGEEAPPGEIGVDVIITFDSGGVSNHPNHAACHAGAVHFAASLARAGWQSPLQLYTLHSTGTLRKYASFLDVPVTMVLALANVVGQRMRSSGRRKGRAVIKGRPDALVSVAAPWEWWRGVRAMVSGHWSQMVWFRWGWVGAGRYMVVNELRRVVV